MENDEALYRFTFILYCHLNPKDRIVHINIVIIINVKMMIIIILPLRVSEGDRLDMMVFVVLDKYSKDCVATQGCVDQKVALGDDHHDHDGDDDPQ